MVVLIRTSQGFMQIRRKLWRFAAGRDPGLEPTVPGKVEQKHLSTVLFFLLNSPNQPLKSCIILDQVEARICTSYCPTDTWRQSDCVL
jgi:hypothetical protein